jgi:hypothetical protein
MIRQQQQKKTTHFQSNEMKDNRPNSQKSVNANTADPKSVSKDDKSKKDKADKSKKLNDNSFDIRIKP